MTFLKNLQCFNSLIQKRQKIVLLSIVYRCINLLGQELISVATISFPHEARSKITSVAMVITNKSLACNQLIQVLYVLTKCHPHFQ